MYLYNSRLHKTPFGAVEVGEEITIKLSVKKQFLPSIIRLYLRKDASADIWTFNLLGINGDMAEYSCTFSVEEAGIYFYRFEAVLSGGRVEFIGRDKWGNAVKGDNLPEWQLTVFEENSFRHKRSGKDIIYHIFIDRFNRCGEKVKPPRGYLKNWDEDVTVVDSDGIFRANDFFGGNLKGVTQKLDYLKSLNVSVVFLSPIFEAASNHRYDTANYMNIDPLVGCESDLDELVAEAGKRGMRIMLDGVFNHTGSDSLYFNKENFYPTLGAYQSKNSPFYDWYSFFDYPEGYHSWWGVKISPTLNKDSKSLRQYLFGEEGVLKKWTEKGVDWRLDVADELSIDFLDDLRERVRKTNENAIVIGEVWEDASTKVSYGKLRPYFTKGQLDGVMNYVFKDAILAYMNDGNSDNFGVKVMDLIENYPHDAMSSSMTMLGSHDTIRIINELSGIRGGDWNKIDQLNYRLPSHIYDKAVNRLKVASAIEYFLPGIPSIYYGDEAGMQGFKDPVNRRTYPWGNERADLLEHYKTLGKIRTTYFNDDDRFYHRRSELLILKRKGTFHTLLVANTTRVPQSYQSKTDLIDLLSGETYPAGAIRINPDCAKIFLVPYHSRPSK